MAAKILSYNRANRAVAILCNHQRAAPKTFEKSMANLQTKVPFAGIFTMLMVCVCLWVFQNVLTLCSLLLQQMAACSRHTKQNGEIIVGFIV